MTALYDPRRDPMVFVTAAEVCGPTALRVTWTDGETREVDLAPWMTRHVVLEMLRIPEVFRDVAVIEGGSGVAWPNGADFCAQALRELADGQRAARRKETA